MMIWLGLVVINAQDVELPLSSDYINEQVNNKKAKIAYPAPFRANTVRMEVPPGKYIVLPFTVETNKDLKFMLRLFTEMPAILKLINSAWVITLVHKILNVTDGGKNFLL